MRIEDTDVARRVEGALEAILDGLRWLGLDGTRAEREGLTDLTSSLSGYLSTKSTLSG